MAHVMREEVDMPAADASGAVPLMMNRLDGIESELRQLRGLVAQQVRVEERSNADRAEVARLAGEVATQREALCVLRDRTQRAGFTVGIVERVFWLAMTVGAAWVSGRGIG